MDRAAPSATGAVRVWDPFVRLFHWSLVACVVFNFLFEDPKAVHEVVGYVATGLVVARVLWGLVGTRHARFADFWPTPARVAGHVRDLLAGRTPFHAGHNPLGALMMLALMALVLALGLTGWLQTTDAYFGAHWLEEVHEAFANTLMGLAGLHAAAAILMGRLERVRLVRAMVTGVKERY